MDYTHASHTFGPVYDANSRILILGSFPSVKSRQQQFYYGHKQNRFWKMLLEIYGDENVVLESIEDKKAFLLSHHIALWDVIESCDIVGSSDSSIKNIRVNDMRVILDAAPIGKIILNGGKAYELFEKYCPQGELPPYVKMPSTSPANAAWSLPRLVEAWGLELNAQM